MSSQRLARTFTCAWVRRWSSLGRFKGHASVYECHVGGMVGGLDKEQVQASSAGQFTMATPQQHSVATGNSTLRTGQACICRISSHPCRKGPLLLPHLHFAQPHLRNDSNVCRAGAAVGPVEPRPKKDKAPSSRMPVPDIKEAHKVFDEVVIVVKAGDGGQGEIVESGRGKWVPNLKYRPGGQQAKKIWLPASEPADGADGADIVLVCDPAYDNLLHLHARKQYSGHKGANANPSAGSGGPKRNKNIKKAATPAFEIPVPPGTVVKRKGSGALVGEILAPGDRLVVAHGGRGGAGVVVPSHQSQVAQRNKALKAAQADGTEVVEVVDRNWKADAQGSPGQQLSLHLLLRVVADVGIVGFPNAGKSSLLRAMTNASPDIAPYPFTTLMPNLGVLSSGPDDNKPVLADLPGLIEGAHQGKGLGRMFLRHLRRTRCLLHVVDASAADPATDYYAVREELRMYNPDYCARPHVVVLNKLDLLMLGLGASGAAGDVGQQAVQLAQAISAAAARHCQEWSKEDVVPLPPAAIVVTSAATGDGLAELNRALAHSLRPDCTKDLRKRGTAATMTLLPPGMTPASTQLASDSDSQDMPLPGSEHHAVGAGMELKAVDAAEQLRFYNSKVQGEEAWAGAHIAAPAHSHTQGEVGGDEEEGEGEEVGQIDPLDAWLFELTESQLLEILAGDERKCAAREKAFKASGVDPYDKDEDLFIAAAAVTAPAAANSQQPETSNENQQASSRNQQPVVHAEPQSGSGTGSEAGHGEGEEDEDEWVELTQEELELLEFLERHEAEEAQEAAAEALAARQAEFEAAAEWRTEQMADGADGQDGEGQGVEQEGGVVAEDERWLFELDEAALERVADEFEQQWESGEEAGEGAGQQGAGGMDVEAGEQQEGGVLEPEDKWLFELNEEQLLELAEQADKACEQPPGH